jgi:UDP-N-acetylglucosamine diphosphorylase / glucose-1-phosphate thymidylyltransferase / UDP-N-acetylgalactosamine diphosphorylase / glucosamine-1-phosphate N-acetyltransferase / galactosamine-1-phosphate N-acetyltransferase
MTDFVIVGNQGNMQRIKDIAGNMSGARFEFAVQTQAMGIADALKSAAPMISGEILIVNPNDVFSRAAYEALLQAYKEKSASSYIVGHRVATYFPGGYLAVNANNELTKIVEKPQPGTEPSDMVNILLHLHTDAGKLLEYIDKAQTTRDDVYECAIDNMCKEGIKIKIARYGGYWAPIKYPWHIFDVVRHFLDSRPGTRGKSASISDSAIISGKVIMGENVRILEHAVIRGPAFIGANTVIGNNALIRDYSHIGADCVVGFSTEIKCSYIGNGCWFHSSYVGDSIIGNNCSFGAGAVTANFRFDEKPVSMKYNGSAVSTGRDHFGAVIGDNCKVGINAGILPGRRLGPNSVVGSHVCLSSDLEPGMAITAQSHYDIVRHDPQPGKNDISQAGDIGSPSG